MMTISLQMGRLIAVAFFLVTVAQATGNKIVDGVEITSNDLSTSFASSSLTYNPDNSIVTNKPRVYYQDGVTEDTLETCSANMVCNKLDTYQTPWMEKQCKCPGNHECSTSLHIHDGHTILDRNKLFKTCTPTRKLRRCKYFDDYSWSYIFTHENSSKQIVHCRCPKGSTAYLAKRYTVDRGDLTEVHFGFACSPPTKLKCHHKEPCKLFSVRMYDDRPDADDVTTNSLCKCPHKRKCPKHHFDHGVVPARQYVSENVKVFTGYCI